MVNKFDAELPIGTRNGISQNITNCISVICNFRNVSPKNTFWERCKKRKCFVIKHLRFCVSQKSENYSHSRAPCAAANKRWLSMSYRVSVKHWLLFLDSFCLFCHAFSNKNVSFADNLFLWHIFYFCFTLNCSICFTLKCSTLILQSLTVFASWVRSYGFITLSAFLLAKILKKNEIRPILPVFRAEQVRFN